MFVRLLLIISFCLLNFAFAAKPLPIQAPFSLATTKADIIAQGVSLLPENFVVGSGSGQNLYFAVRVPDSIYPKALYKFSFDSNDKLTRFGIILSDINSGYFSQLQKTYTRKYGSPSFDQEGTNKQGQAYYYVNWGVPPANYMGMTYLPDEELLLIAYFLNTGSNS